MGLGKSQILFINTIRFYWEYPTRVTTVIAKIGKSRVVPMSRNFALAFDAL